jgi:NTP pyrophosphatase (non-canonical NTP hydrolase)
MSTPHPPTQAEVAAWNKRNFGPEVPLEHQVLVLAEEVGELSRAVVKRAQGIRGSHAHWSEQIRAEAADVLITLLSIAETEGFDLHQAAAAKWGEVTSRDPRAPRVSENGQGPV